MERRTVSPDEWQVELTPFDEARSRVIAAVEPMTAVYVTVGAALGMVTAQNVAAPVNVPAFDNSSMDGYAVDSANVIQGTSVGVETVRHISTGMALPEGTDSVVPWEHTRSDGATVTFEQPVLAGQFVRAAGHDIAAGDIVVPAGSELGPVHLGALASVGNKDVLVYGRPRVSILVTGEELATPGTFPTATSIFDVNSTLLPALVQRAGGYVDAVERCTDDRDVIAKTLQRLCASSDVVITTGGASVGERDWVRTVVQEDGEVSLWRVAVRPGKPFAVGRFDNTPVLMLPGNPGSVLACTHGFVAPVIRRLRGASAMPVQTQHVLSETLTNDQDRTFLCPVAIEDNAARPLVGASSQGLHHALSVVGFVVAPPRSVADAGSTVVVEHMA